MEKEKQIEIRSDSVKEILGTPPKWLVSWGTVIIFLTLSTLFLLSWLVKFPDEIQAQITVKSTNPPREVIPKISGQLGKLFVREKEEVKKGQLLAIIENDANYQDILYLDSMVTDIQDYSISEFSNLIIPEQLNLGALQTTFNTFEQAVDNLKYAVSQLNNSSRSRSIATQIENIEFLRESEQKERSRTYKKIRELKRKILNASKAEKRKLEETLEDLEDKFQEQNKKIQEQDSKIDELKQSKIEKQIGSKTEANDKHAAIKNEVRNLQEKIDRWKYQHLMLAPLEGEVVFLEVWDERQYVQKGEAPLAIKPETGRMYGLGKLPSVGSGKVEKGQEVIIKLASYPFQEFGVVKGKVEKTFVLPSSNQTIVEISLPEGLLTTQNKELKFKERMEGRAEIYTQNRRIIEWIFERFLYKSA